MRRLFLLLLLIGCKKEPAAAPAPPPTTTAAVKSGAPWTLDRSRSTPPNIPDALTFFGWSADGRRYAFQIDVEAEGADCSDEHHLYVVDAVTDRFVDQITAKREQPEGGADGCVPPDLNAVLDEQRPAVLERHGVVVGNFVPPVRPTKRADDWSVRWADGATSTIGFEVRHTTDDPYGPEAERGAAYRLTVDGRVVEPGTRRRAGVLRYGLDDGFVFEAPAGAFAAIFVQRFVRAFEGARPSWMSNGLAIANP